ncbi:MAG: TAXI family TRAP transporter solute-binding subunit [Rhodospirillales bacterium]|nr:TAXI family TRAP transporter solute-binding subunit [Rhodospirillales bacterium]
MKKLLLASVALAFGVAAMAMGTQPAEAAKKTFIAIGTGGPTGVYFVTGNAICRMVHKAAAEGRSSGRKHGIRCSAPSTGGSTYNIGQIREGELDFGVAQSDWQYHAFNGSSKFEGNAFKKLRAVFSVHPEPIQIIVGEGADIDGWEDLKGKKVNIGNPGSGQRGTADMLIKEAGWTKADFALAAELTSTEQSKALCDGKIDAIFYTVGVPNAGVAVATDGCDAKIANFDGPLAKKMVTMDKPYYAWATIPKGTYKTTDADVKTWGVKATFVTSADVSDDVVYEVVRAVFENIDDFRALHKAFQNLDPKTMIKDGLSAPLHPGAIKYYKEKGWM